jgi:predicted glutamine amidotransferase
MCRLFGMNAGHEPTAATFWLLDAPDSLEQQSHREPDGTGVGVFDAAGTAEIFKQPIAAYEDRAFAQEAKELRSRTFVAHIRFASNGPSTLENTHPFELDNRIFAHNGVIGETDRLDASRVRGDTDSERFFALITKQIDEHGGDIGAGITAAAAWVAANLPVYALNCILTTATDLWALRYPDTHELHVLHVDAGGGPAHHIGSGGRMRVHTEERPAVVVASEPMNDDPGWRALASGELVHVDADLGVSVSTALPQPPARLMTLADLSPRAAASQHER